ncbi:unnamed protein product, partial [Symbiodinium necroappetens]
MPSAFGQWWSTHKVHSHSWQGGAPRLACSWHGGMVMPAALLEGEWRGIRPEEYFFFLETSPDKSRRFLDMKASLMTAVPPSGLFCIPGADVE